MSEENVETVQRAVDAWNADDLDAFLAELDADVEWYPSIEPSLQGKATTYRGHDGARKGWREYRGEAWERLTIRPREFRDLGESVRLQVGRNPRQFAAQLVGLRLASLEDHRRSPPTSRPCGLSR